MCLYPVNLKSRLVYSTGELLPPQVVPCGKCYECLNARRSAWTFRVSQEYLHSKSAFFVTLTYSDEHLPKHQVWLEEPIAVLSKSDLQKYIKRLRTVNKSKLVYFGVGEYGEKNQRPHYHLILFNAERQSIADKWTKRLDDGTITPIGNIKIGSVSTASIHYVTGYCLKNNIDVEDSLKQDSSDIFHRILGIQKPFAVMSKGLGKAYADDAKGYHIGKETFLTPDGKPLSRYLKMKMFKDNELKRLEITEKVSKEIEEKLLKDRRTLPTAKAYYKAIHEHIKKRKSL